MSALLFCANNHRSRTVVQKAWQAVYDNNASAQAYDISATDAYCSETDNDWHYALGGRHQHWNPKYHAKELSKKCNWAPKKTAEEMRTFLETLQTLEKECHAKDNTFDDSLRVKKWGTYFASNNGSLQEVSKINNICNQNNENDHYNCNELRRILTHPCNMQHATSLMVRKHEPDYFWHTYNHVITLGDNNNLTPQETTKEIAKTLMLFNKIHNNCKKWAD